MKKKAWREAQKENKVGEAAPERSGGEIKQEQGEIIICGGKNVSVYKNG